MVAIAAGVVGGAAAVAAVTAYVLYRRRQQRTLREVVASAHPMFMHTKPLKSTTAETQFGWGSDYETGTDEPWSSIYSTGDSGQIYVVPRSPVHPIAEWSETDYDMHDPSQAWSSLYATGKQKK